MPSESSPRLSTPATVALEQIDSVCDQFEGCLLRQERPRLEEFLDEVAPVEQSRLFEELLLLELDYARRRGETPSKDEYLRRFPEFSQQVETAAFNGALDGTVIERTHGPSPEPRSGARLGRFTLTERVGVGAAGEVWRAYDGRLARWVAVKMPRFRQEAEEDVNRFLREARSASQLRHPGIVVVHEAGRDRGQPYLVSDYIEGGTLRDVIRRGELTRAERVALCAKLADALHYAHEHGVVHRDLKPANVLMDRSSHPHITDFGLAKWRDDARTLTIDGQLLGTPAYMSPEQARGDATHVDGRADVFSLGVILYELMTGALPWAGDQRTLLAGVLDQPPPPPRRRDRTIPRDLETICLKGLEKDPARRYESAAAMGEDLRRYLVGEPTAARPLPAPQKIWRWLKRRPAAAAAIALAALAVVMMAAAGALAERNRALQGYQTVHIRTEPAGAELAIVPLDAATGQPVASRLMRPGRSPLSCSLRAGDYQIVAVGEGRFHEVLRHVPHDVNSMPVAYAHQSWRTNEAGEVVWKPIRLFSEAEVIDGMAAVRPRAAWGAVPPHQSQSFATLDPFYVDCREFTVGDYRRRLNHGKPPRSGPEGPPPDDASMIVNFDQAAAYAEACGKRLPTAAELLYLVELDEGRRRSLANRSVQKVADRREASPPLSQIAQLQHGLPEWTSTWPLAGRGLRAMAEVKATFPAHYYRLVWGRAPASETGLADPSLQDQGFTAAPRTSSFGIGFRAVRSARPPYAD